jgi:hypothetical protein
MDTRQDAAIRQQVYVFHLLYHRLYNPLVERFGFSEDVMEDRLPFFGKSPMFVLQNSKPLRGPVVSQGSNCSEAGSHASESEDYVSVFVENVPLSFAHN